MAPRITNRSEKRKNATEREKARMANLSRDIDHIQSLVCPEMTQPTKSKVLRVAVDRLNYLENLFLKLKQLEENEQVHQQPAQHIEHEWRQNENTNFQLIQNSSIGPNSPSTASFDSEYSPVDYSNQSHPGGSDESLISVQPAYEPFYSSSGEIQAYQPFDYNQSYTRSDLASSWQPEQPTSRHMEANSAALFQQKIENQNIFPVGESNDGNSLKNQADSFFEQFEHEIASCL